MGYESKERKSFNAFFVENQQRFSHLAYSYVRNIEIAEDLVVESFVYYWEHKDALREDTEPRAYVATTLKHKCLNHLARLKKRLTIENELSAHQEWELSLRIQSLNEFIPEEIYTEEIQALVNQTLAQLPTRTREIFEMSRYENKTHKEISAYLGISTKNVEYHITKSLNELRKVLKDYLLIFLLF